MPQLPLNDDPFAMDGRPAPDLANPKHLMEQLDMIAGGLDQQSDATKQTSAMGGHPFPGFFYANAADVARAAKAYIAGTLPKEEKKEPAKPEKAPRVPVSG